MTQEALKLALEALEANYLLVNGTETHGGLEQCLDGYYSGCFNTDPINKQTEEAITAIKEALAQTQEPWCMKMNDCKTKCEDCPDEPPQRTWVDLTDEQIDFHLDKILRAAGTALKHYSMQKSKDDMRQALREAFV